MMFLFPLWFLLQVLTLSSLVISAVSPNDRDDAPVEEHVLAQRSIESGTWAAHTRSLLDDFSTCNGCQNILSVLKGLVKDGDSALLSLGTQLCTSGTPYDEQFCDGIMQREGPVIAEIVRDMDLNSTSSVQFCITFLGVCKAPAVDAWPIPFPSKKKCDDKRPLPSGKDPIKVVHYSDIHVDPLYVKGSSTKCKKPTCCRPYTDGDQPGKTEFPAGPNGDHNCDTPISLENSLYQAIEDMFPDQAFTIFTGDIVDHSLFNTSQPYNLGERRFPYPA